MYIIIIFWNNFFLFRVFWDFLNLSLYNNCHNFICCRLRDRCFLSFTSSPLCSLSVPLCLLHLRTTPTAIIITLPRPHPRPRRMHFPRRLQRLLHHFPSLTRPRQLEALTIVTITYTTAESTTSTVHLPRPLHRCSHMKKSSNSLRKGSQESSPTQWQLLSRQASSIWKTNTTSSCTALWKKDLPTRTYWRERTL